MAETMFDFMQATTTTPDTSGAIEASKDAQFYKGLSTIFNKGAEIATQYYTKEAEEKSVVDASQAKWDGLQHLSDVSYQSGTDQITSIKTYTDKVRERLKKGEVSDAYAKTYESLMIGGFGQALGAQEKEHEGAAAYMAKEAYSAVQLAGLQKEMSPSQFVEWYSKEYKVKPKAIQSSVIASLYETGSSLYDNIFNGVDPKQPLNLTMLQERINNADTRFAEMEKHFSGDTYFYGSRAADMVEKISQGKQEVSLKATQARKTLENIAKGFIGDSEGNREDLYNMYNVNPSDKNLLKAHEIAYDNPLTRKRAYEEYTKGWSEAVEAKDFLAKNPVDKFHTDYSIKNNSLLNKYYPRQVSQGITEALMENNPSKLINIIQANPNDLAAPKNDIMNFFNVAQTVDQIKPLYNFLENMRLHPQGASAMRHWLGDENYVFVTSTIDATSLYGGDLTKARNFVAQADQAAVTVPMNKDIYEHMNSYKEELGPQFTAFNNVVNMMHKLNPAISKGKIDEAFKLFENQVQIVKADKEDSWFGSDKIYIDKSMADYFANNALDEEYLNNRIIGSYREKNGHNPTAIIPLGNTHTSIVLDKWGGVAEFDNYERDLDKANAAFTKQKVETSEKYNKERGAFGKFIDAAGDIFIGNTVRISEGMYHSVGKLVNTFTGYMGKQWDKDVNTLYSALGLNTKEEKEAMEVAMFMREQELSDTVNKVGKFKPPTNMMSPGTHETLRSVLTKSNVELQQLREMNNDIRMNSLLKYEGGYSKDRKDIGNYNSVEDYKAGKNFIGTKYGISAPTLSTVLGRPATANDMKNLSENQAKQILKRDYFDKYKIGELPPQIQKVALHAYMLSPSNAEKALKMGGKSSADFGRNFINQLERNTTNYNTYGYSWSKRFKDLGVE